MHIESNTVIVLLLCKYQSSWDVMKNLSLYRKNPKNCALSKMLFFNPTCFLNAVQDDKNCSHLIASYWMAYTVQCTSLHIK